MISVQNVNEKTPTPKTPIKNALPKPQPPNTNISGISYIGILSVALWADTHVYTQIFIKFHHHKAEINADQVLELWFRNFSMAASTVFNDLEATLAGRNGKSLRSTRSVYKI